MTRHIHSEWGRRVPTNPDLDATNRHYVSDPSTRWPYILVQFGAVAVVVVALAIIVAGRLIE